MTSRFSAILTVVLAALATATAHGAVRVWAASDGIRVSPIDGRALEARPDIHRDYPRGDFRAGNLIWNAATRTVTIAAARNEFTAFQAIVETDGPLESVDVTVTPLSNSGREITGRNVALFKEWYVHVRRPSTGYEKSSLGPEWYPDALLPYRRRELNTGFPFSIPDLYNNVPGQTNQAVWVDIFVPFERESSPPGDYRGELKVAWQGGEARMNISLHVWDFALPQENHLPGDIWNDSLREMPPAQEMTYYQLARQHRFLPLVYGYRPKIRVDGGVVALDWTDYDQRLAPYLDGSAFTSAHGYWGPGYGVPADHMMLPFNVEKHGNPATAWPIPVPAEGRTASYESAWTSTARQIREHFDQNSAWKKVRKIAFLDGLDESYSEDAYEKMTYYGRLLHKALGRDWFWYRIDGGYSAEAMRKLSSEVDLWVCHTVDYNQGTIEQAGKDGVRAWFYGPMIYEQEKNSGCGSNTFLDLDLLVSRGIGWVGWKYQTGWVEWEFDWNAFASWYEAENFKEPGRIYNGSGQLIYRGTVMGYDQPVPSIRLKAQRRGLQDYEYFWLLSERTGSKDAANAIVNRIVYKRPFGRAAMLDTEVWKNNPEDWERARIEAGQQIAHR